MYDAYCGPSLSVYYINEIMNYAQIVVVGTTSDH